MIPIPTLSSNNLLSNPIARLNTRKRKSRVQSLDVTKQKSSPILPPLFKQPSLAQMPVLSSTDVPPLRPLKSDLPPSRGLKRNVFSSIYKIAKSDSQFSSGSESTQLPPTPGSTPRHPLRPCGSFSNIFNMKGLQAAKEPRKSNKVEIFN